MTFKTIQLTKSAHSARKLFSFIAMKVRAHTVNKDNLADSTLHVN